MKHENKEDNIPEAPPKATEIPEEIDWSEIDELARKVALGLMKRKDKNVDKSDS